MNEVRQGKAITGGDVPDRFLITSLRVSIRQAERIDFITSFLMESGVRLLIQELRDPIERGVPVRILTGNYLNITQPSALYLLRKEFGNKIDLHFYNERNRSFHAKSYIFRMKDHREIYVGSSNISFSAMTSGIEWNYRFTDVLDAQSLQEYCDEFDDLFDHHSYAIDDEVLKEYSDHWHCPSVYPDIERTKAKTRSVRIAEEDTLISNWVQDTARPQPRGAQIEALYALEQSRAQGAQKALVQAATGIGKTYLAAFDSMKFHRVLFVAHRHEILKQAQQSFHKIRPADSYGFFDGDAKDTTQTMIFASVETLGNEKYLKSFDSTAFDYIVVDEFHHAVTKQYQKILAYFIPQFLLGLTATPERMDGRDIYELCDYNVPFELSLHDAINKNFLCPFHYYGIYDETDYSGLKFVRGHYEEKELNKIYIGNQHRSDLIYKYYKKYPARKALGFCCSRKHAEDMAKEFTLRGIPSAAVYSGRGGPYAMNRKEALNALRIGKISVIFSVDMFSEGLDVPNVDMVMFLRPTESPIVFLQQLGRGLRKSEGKAYLTVLDFIGNYARAGQVRTWITGKNTETKTPEQAEEAIPDRCLVDFDMKLIDLFHEMEQKSMKVSDRIDGEVDRIREELHHIPTRMELFSNMDDEIYDFCRAHRQYDPFRRYIDYRFQRGWLSEAEKKILEAEPAKDFLEMISTTAMAKVYKMPILLCFYNNGHPRMEITDQQVLQSWKKFFHTGTNWQDIDPKLSYAEFQKMTDAQHLRKAKTMPIHFLLKSGKGFFVEKPNAALALREDLHPLINDPIFIQEWKDIIDYRTIDYYRRRYYKKKKR